MIYLAIAVIDQMALKKILIITYYWPPSGGGGVQRWLKFAKYLPEFGWEPIVFTPENPEFDLKDDSLTKEVSPELEVIRFPIWEPFGFYKKIFKKGGKLKQGIVIEKTKMSLIDRLSVWIRANLFIPDPRRFWVKPSVEFLVPFIHQHNIDVVVTTGPPHSMHLIGKSLKKKCQVKWVADFRDPWSDWDILEKLGVKGIALSIHRKLERNVLGVSDLVLVASKGIRRSLIAKYDKTEVRVVTNGYDTDDLKGIYADTKEKKFRITHMGLLNELRNPETLWDCLEEICDERPDFQSDLELVLAGMVSSSILDRIQSSQQLSHTLNHLDYISHQEVLEYYLNSSVLLLLLNQTDTAQLIIPGKLFEYLMVNKPVLAIGKRESEVQEILSETEAGEVFNGDDRDQIKQMILIAYDRFRNGDISRSSGNAEKYLRKNLTHELVSILDQLSLSK
ncbi:MAG: glycosyltransferase family 4 protein [Reichenbachiella sp.]|uniref:glycosyltransferase family 4 protein n=2 Tax=Reichenbachiella sp. TaxID=2184521 RepID=UPI003264E94F